MDLLSLVRERLIVPDFHAPDKMTAIHQLIDYLVVEGEVPHAARDDVLGAVIRREEERSTGIAGGLALPHGVVDVLEREVAVVGLSEKGIGFGALDHRPARVIILLVTPRSLTSRHTEIVRNIAVLMHGSELLSSLPCCSTVEQAVSCLSSLP